MSKLSAVYYRLFTEDGEVPSKCPVNKDDPSLARIDARLIAPPHTVASIKRCLANFEGLGYFISASSAKLYVNLLSESPMDREHVSILTSHRPGSTPEEPMGLVLPPLPENNAFTGSGFNRCE